MVSGGCERTYIFRGKTDSGKWVYGSLIMADDYCCILEKEEDLHPMDYPYLDGFIGTFDGTATPVKPETVSQWTGLVDENGFKIFEGDIITPAPNYNSKYSRQGIVEYGHYNTDGRSYEIYGYKVIGDWVELEYCIVVGNKWDNPELMDAIEGN